MRGIILKELAVGMFFAELGRIFRPLLYGVRMALASTTRPRPEGPSKMTSVERASTHTACLIIGAGHVGISVARGLRREGIDPVLLEQNAAIGDAWRHRWP